MDKITQILENVVRCKYFEADVHIKNPIKNSYQDGLSRTTQTLDHVVVVLSTQNHHPSVRPSPGGGSRLICNCSFTLTDPHNTIMSIHFTLYSKENKVLVFITLWNLVVA